MAKEYVFRVKPQDYRNNYRVIRIGGGRTLHDLHLAILDAYDFYADHLYMFSPDRKPYDRNGYYSPDDDGMNSADQAVLEKLDLKKGDRWLYLFDFGDEWKFDVTVKDIEEGRSNRKAQVLEGKGELVQYPDWDDEEWDEEHWDDEDWEDEDALPFGDEPEEMNEEELLAMTGLHMIEVDVLDEGEKMENMLADHDVEELRVLMEVLEIAEEQPETQEGKRKKGKALQKKMAARIAETLRAHPALLERLMGASGICLLKKLAKDRKLDLKECLLERYELGMMNALGLAVLEEAEGGIIYLTRDAMSFADFFEKDESGSRLEEKAGKERLIAAVIRFYEVMEADRLYEMFCGLSGGECGRQEFDGIISVMELEYRVLCFEKEKEIYLTCLDDVNDAQRVLALREVYQAPDYRLKTRKELEDAYGEKNVPSSMPELLEYLIVEKRVDIEDCAHLEQLMKAGADLGFSLSDIEDEIREILGEYRMRLTKRLREMMTSVMEEFPSASLRGYSMKEIRELSVEEKSGDSEK